jgi:hypothetical protein
VPKPKTENYLVWKQTICRVLIVTKADNIITGGKLALSATAWPNALNKHVVMIEPLKV